MDMADELIAAADLDAASDYLPRLDVLLGALDTPTAIFVLAHYLVTIGIGAARCAMQKAVTDPSYADRAAILLDLPRAVVVSLTDICLADEPQSGDAAGQPMRQ